jgi:hypothetical protein
MAIQRIEGRWTFVEVARLLDENVGTSPMVEAWLAAVTPRG